MQVLNLKCAGLYSFPNPLGTVPSGALITAQNGVIDRPDTFEVRRGQQQYGPVLTYPFQAMYNFNDTLMGWDTNNQFWYDSDGSGTWVSLNGTYTAPSGVYRIKSAEASGNLYFATSSGVIGLTQPTSTFYQAGVPYPLDSTSTLNTGSGWFLTGNTVGYRATLSYTDTNQNLHVSQPSQRLVVSNETGGDCTVTLTWYIPPNIPADYSFQVWRTIMVADISGVSQDPGDEEYLVVDQILTSADITNGYFTYTDQTPDDLLGETLYTNPSQQTIAGANTAPPLCKDLTYYLGNMLYANAQTPQTVIINMITTPTDGDTITIGGVVYTAASTATPTSGIFKVFTSGTPGQNIDNTARSLVRAINAYSANTQYWAIYTSGYTTLPGQITLIARGLGTAAFVITSSNGTVYSPQIPATGSSYTSTSSSQPNYVYCSKVQIPEAVPLANYIPIGSKDKAIIRIVALRTSVFVFKDDGVYRILGTDITNFTVTPFDLTVILTAPDSIAIVNNQIWAMTNQGTVAISDSGSVIQSRPIERDLITLSSALYPNFTSSTFGIGYESDRHYNLWTNTATTDAHATQNWVYNFLTTCWTNWPISITSGIVSLQPDDHLYLCYATGQVTRERKNWNNFDFADFSYTVTITGSNGLIVDLVSTTNVETGYTLYQTDSSGNIVGQSIITAVVDSTHITVTDIVPWVAYTATVYQPISVNMAYTPISGNVGWIQHYTDWILYFRPDSSFRTLSLSVNSDFSGYDETIVIPGQVGSLFGSVPFGDEPFGGQQNQFPAIRTLIPRNKARCHWLNPSLQHNEAIANFACTGMNFFYNYVSSRFR